MTAYHAEASELDGKEILTWAGFGDASRELAAHVAASGFRPDVIGAAWWWRGRSRMRWG